jgi:hypothetical protein
VLRSAWPVALLYLALTLALAYPLTRDPGGRVLAIAPDTDLFMWTLAWDAHAFVRQPLSIFDANIYHPQPRTLAYSENLIGVALFAAPVLWITNNPVLAMNLVALLSCALCGLGAWLLARRLGFGAGGAVLCGLVFAFSPPRFLRLGQLHLTSIQWIPFALAFVHTYLDRGRRRDLRVAAGFFTLQALSSGHGAVFLSVAVLGLAGYRTVLGEPIAIRQRLRDLGAPGLLLLAPAVLMLVPYLAVQREMGLRRSLADSAAWTLPAASFLASPARVHALVLSKATDAPINAEAYAYLFPGYLPLLLSIAALVPRRRAEASAPVRYGTAWTRVALALDLATLVLVLVALIVLAAGPVRWQVGATTVLSIRQISRVLVLLAACVLLRAALVRRVPLAVTARCRRWKEMSRPWRAAWRTDVRAFYALVTLVSVWLAAGPPVGLWPIVYWLPGLNFVRVPSRFSLLAILGLAVLAAAGFERLTARMHARSRTLVAGVLGLLLVAEFAVIPLETAAYRVEVPEVDRWLDRQPKPFAVAEVPIPTAREGGEERRQTLYMLHSTAHWQPTVHGYSGLRPASHTELFFKLRRFPDRESLDQLEALGVSYVVVHTDLYAPGEWPAVEKRLQEHDAELRLAHEDGQGRVYSLVASR